MTVEQLAVVNNKTKVTAAQIDEFLQLCWTKFVKAKIEPGELFFLHSFPAELLLMLLYDNRYCCRSYRCSIDRRTRYSNDAQNFPFRWCRFHERNSRSSSYQGDYQRCENHLDTYHFGETRSRSKRNGCSNR